MNYSIQTGQLYFGDCALGDREATIEEIADWESSQLPKPQDVIATLLAAKGLTQVWQVESALAGMQALAAASGFTEEQLYATDPGYKEAKDLYIKISAEKAKI